MSEVELLSASSFLLVISRLKWRILAFLRLKDHWEKLQEKTIDKYLQIRYYTINHEGEYDQ